MIIISQDKKSFYYTLFMFSKCKTIKSKMNDLLEINSHNT